MSRPCDPANPVKACALCGKHHRRKHNWCSACTKHRYRNGHVPRGPRVEFSTPPPAPPGFDPADLQNGRPVL